MDIKNPWLIIVIAGIFEIIWAVAMDSSEGLTVWYYDLIFIVFLVLSVFLLSRALKRGIPVGTAYAVWTGIGAVGTIVISSVISKTIPGALSILFVIMIIGGIIGLQLTSKGT